MLEDKNCFSFEFVHFHFYRTFIDRVKVIVKLTVKFRIGNGTT